MLIPVGTYPAHVTASALGFAGTGNPQLAISFDIEVPDVGTASRTWYGFFTEKGEPTTVKALAALGFDAATRDLMGLSPENPAATPIAGAECFVVIEHDIQNRTGETVDKIRWVNSKDGAGLAMKERMSAAQAAEFAAKFRARVSSGRPATSPAPGSNVGKTVDPQSPIPF